jgi:hypothetical protein
MHEGVPEHRHTFARMLFGLVCDGKGRQQDKERETERESEKQIMKQGKGNKSGGEGAGAAQEQKHPRAPSEQAKPAQRHMRQLCKGGGGPPRAPKGSVL